MKKQLFSVVMAALSIAFAQVPSEALAQPCSQPTNLIFNGNFSSGFSGFSSGLSLMTTSSPNCPVNRYGIGTAFNDFCTSFPSSPSGTDMMVVDFGGFGVNTMVLQQTITNVTAGVNYTVSLRGACRNSSYPVPLKVYYDSYYLGTITITSAAAFANYSLSWTAPVGVPSTGAFKILIGSTNSWNDFTITDLAFSYCPVSLRNTYENRRDQNHFSVVELDNGFVVAGTLFPRGDLINTSAWVRRFNDVGALIWEREYDMDRAHDSRCFDIAVGPDGKSLALTGYVQESSNSQRKTYVMTLRSADGSLMDYEQFTLGTYSQSTGLDIQYSNSTQEYHVAGYQSGNILDDGANKVGFVMALDPNLGVNWVKKISSPASLSTDNMANNLTEIEGTGVFVTGSVNNVNSGTISSLKVLLDYSGAVIWDLSSLSSNSHECGVDAVYDKHDDVLYFLSNNSAVHTFEIQEILNASTGSASIGSHGANFLLNDLSSNVEGFSIDFDQDKKYLVVGGMIQSRPNGTGHTPSFIAHVDMSGFSVSKLRYIETKNTGYSTHDHDMFQAFLGQQAKINYPDILAVLPSNFIILGYAGLSGYSHTITQTDASGHTRSSEECEVLISSEGYPTTITMKAATVNTQTATSTRLSTNLTLEDYDVYKDCTPLDIAKKRGTGISGAVSVSEGLSVYPNPASTALNVDLPNTGTSVHVETRLLNAMGQVVIQQSGDYAAGATIQYDVATLPEGLYFLSVNAGTFTAETRVVISHK